MPVRNLQILVLVVIISAPCYFQAKQLRYAGRIGTAIELIEEGYVNEVDPEDLYNSAMQGIVADLDPYSAFIPPSKFEEFQSTIEQRFGGLGILIEGPPTSNRLTVVTPIPGTPAFEAGLRPGDTIISIDGVSTENMDVAKAQELMKGPLGESVNLEIKRETLAEHLFRSIERANVQVNSVYGDRIQNDSEWNYFLEEDSRIAYLRITVFGEQTYEEFKKALAEIEDDAEALVIDLRGNPGGVLRCAVQLCDLLIDEGTIVSTRGRTEERYSEFVATPEIAFNKNTPIVLLVNEGSASASEIMAGCLQDLGRALVAGQRSFGKGTVQEVIELEPNRSALKFTTAKFYRPSGKNINRSEEMTDEDDWGVSPEPMFDLPLDDTQSLYLKRRWRNRNDPREMTREIRPPAPECAGDPQLKLVLDYLRNVLDGQSAASKVSEEEAEATVASPEIGESK